MPAGTTWEALTPSFDEEVVSRQAPAAADAPSCSFCGAVLTADGVGVWGRVLATCLAVQRLGCIASRCRGGRFDVGRDLSKDQSPNQGAERTDQLPVGGEPTPSGGIGGRGTCLGRDQRSVGPVGLARMLKATLA